MDDKRVDLRADSQPIRVNGREEAILPTSHLVQDIRLRSRVAHQAISGLRDVGFESHACLIKDVGGKVFVVVVSWSKPCRADIREILIGVVGVAFLSISDRA